MKNDVGESMRENFTIMLKIIAKREMRGKV